MEKLGYTSQVGNVVFGQGAPASIAIGSTKKISGRTEMNSSYTGGSSTKRNYMWQKDTADGFRSFSTKKKGKVIRTGMTHPKVTRRTNFLFFKKKHTNGVTHKIKMHVDTVLSYRHMQIIL